MPPSNVRVGIKVTGTRVAIKNFDRFTRRAQQLIKRRVRQSAEAIRASYASSVRTDQGETARSTQVQFLRRGTSARIGSTAIQAIAADYGLKPGSKQPPPEKLRGWVERRLGLSGTEAKQATFLIARKIGREGFSALPALRPTFDAERKRFAKNVRKDIRALPRRLAVRSGGISGL